MVQLESFSPNLEKNQKRKNKTKIKNNEENPPYLIGAQNLTNLATN